MLVLSLRAHESQAGKGSFPYEMHSHDFMHQIQATAVHDNSTPSFESHELCSNETDVYCVRKEGV